MKNVMVSGLIGGLVIFFVSTVSGAVFSALMPFNVLTLGGMRSAADPVMLLFFLSPFVLSFALAFAYSKLEKAFRGGPVSKGIAYGTLMWLAGGLHSAFVVFTSMDYPIGFTMDSLAGSLAYTLAGCITIIWAYEKF